MSRWNSFLRAALGCLLAAVLAGCATMPAPISTEQKLTGQEGAVVFKFITNGGGSGSWQSDPADTLSSITLTRELPVGAQASQADKAILSRTRATSHTTAVFSGLVAPGRYRISHATGFQTNTTYTFPLGGMSNRFEVKSGQVTLLGTLLVQPLEGRRFTMGYVPPDAELTQTFEDLFPALAKQTRGQPVNTFEPSSELAFRTDIAPKFKLMTTTHNGVNVESDGTMLAGSKMGRVIWRKAGSSTWQTLQIDTWRAVLSVRRYRNGLLAAGEEGLLRYSSDEGKTWQALTPPAAGLIALAQPLSNGKVAALVRRDTTWTAYLTDNPMAGVWRKVASFEQERSLNVPWQNAIALGSGSFASILMPNGNYTVLESADEKVKQRATGVSTFGAQVMPDGMLVVSGGTMTRSTLISKDAGKTWTDLNTSRFIGVITFLDASTAYAIAPVNPGITAGSFALMVSRDGAKTWTKTGEVPGGATDTANSMAYDRSSGSLLAFMQSGQVLQSADEGKTWKRSF